MPRFYPDKLFSDCWSSYGDITIYHRNGKCYYRKRKRKSGKRPMSDAATTVHRRALQAWRTLSQETQERWSEHAKHVSSHRPPFDNGTYISGYNLFVSAYHGFATLGNEHVPEPQPYCPFPQFNLTYVRCQPDGPRLTLHFHLTVWTPQPARYALLGKIQSARPDAAPNVSRMHNQLATAGQPISRTDISCTIPVTFTVQHDATKSALHMQYLLIDNETGYRCNYKKLSITNY